MKNSPKHLLISFLVLMIIPVAKSQDCNFYIPLNEDSGVEYQIYNQRDRLQGSQELTITEVNSRGNETTATIHAKSFDRRNDLEHEMDYNVSCRDGELIIDMKSMMDDSMLQGFQDMELNFESDNLILPSELSTGQQLPDASMTMTARQNGMSVAEINMNIVNRRVGDKEEITVPAGTFDCYVIAYETNMVTKTMGIPFKVKTKTIEYYNPEVGMVRTEHYDEKDRLQSYMILSNIF